jgi:ribosomal protein S18
MKDISKSTCQVDSIGEDEQHQNWQNLDDMPKPIKDPYKKPMHQCIFCKYNIPLDYKNVQLLSQFISQHTGIVYSQHVTGLCHFKQTELEETVHKARMLGLMPFFYKETMFVLDEPNLFNPFKNNLKQIEDNYDKRQLNADPTILDTEKK